MRQSNRLAEISGANKNDLVTFTIDDLRDDKINQNIG
jgi:hypothetical protein